MASVGERYEKAAQSLQSNIMEHLTWLNETCQSTSTEGKKPQNPETELNASKKAARHITEKSSL